ncbi:MAG TPA: VWA domain-containing protein [Terriglobia bacterium]|nr:VWA domain-containing protein [Terriglobia bacterium]
MIGYVNKCERPLLVARLFYLLIVASGLVPIWAQQAAGTNTSSNQTNEPYKLGVRTNVVIVRAVVRDSHGRVVAGLHKEDFRIADNRKEQEINGFSVETEPGNEVSSPLAPEASGPATPPSRQAESNAGEPRTFLALYFDDLNSEFETIVRSRDAAEKFIAGLPGTERIAIFTSSGAVSVDFTNDLKILHDGLFKLRANSRVSSKGDCLEITDFIADRIIEKENSDAYRILRDQAINQCHWDPRSVTEPGLRMFAQASYTMYVAQARQNLAGIDSVLDRLARMPGERQVMLVSEGFMPLDMRDRMEHVIDHALRSHVIISALDGKGLVVIAREADASRSRLPGGEIGGVYHMYDDNREAEATATLADIAEGKGGQFFHNNNDLTEGFRRSLRPPEIAYILSFSPQGLRNDGAFHELKVTLANNRGLKVQARKGYFAPDKKASPVKQAVDQLSEAIFSPDPIEDLPIHVQTNLTDGGPESEQAEVSTKLDVRSLPFKVEKGRNVNNVLFVVAVFDHDGKYLKGNQQEIELNLRDSELEDLEKTGLTFRAKISGKSGGQIVRVVVREMREGKMAALSTILEAAP